MSLMNRAAKKKEEHFESLRRGMIIDQLRSRDITDSFVLNAMARVPRERFVPIAYQDEAYDDKPLPIGWGQTISQPYIVAKMLEAAELLPIDHLLEIGTGSGYAAAVASRIVERVYTIERIEPLLERALALFEELEYTNIIATVGNGILGWPDKAPFDAIIVSAASTEIPQTLKEQLAPGGRLVIPVGNAIDQSLIRIRSENDRSESEEDLGGVRFVPLV